MFLYINKSIYPNFILILDNKVFLYHILKILSLWYLRIKESKQNTYKGVQADYKNIFGFMGTLLLLINSIDR